MPPDTKRIVSRSPAGTQRIARSLLRTLGPGSVIALHGELGSGKTCFVQGLAKALGIVAPVASPTFTLVHEYRGRLPLYHVDLYRIAAPQEAVNLGLDEYLEGDGITAIEWAERLLDTLPADAVHVHMEPGKRPKERIITISRHIGPALPTPNPSQGGEPDPPC